VLRVRDMRGVRNVLRARLKAELHRLCKD